MNKLILMVMMLFMFCGSDDSNPITDPPDTGLGKVIIGGNLEERAAAVVEATDGGFIIAGKTWSSSEGGSDLYIVKTNSEFEVLWEKTFGGSEDEEAWTIIKSSDGNYLCSGSTESFGAGDRDLYLVKIDASGNELWSKTYGTAGWENRGFVQETTDGGLIISGWTGTSDEMSTTDMYLIRTNSVGEIIWEKSYGGSDADGANSVRQCPDGGFAVYGEGLWDTTGEWQGILIKTDGDGNLLWGKTFGYSGSEEGYGMQLAHDSGFVAVGFSNSGGPKGYILKTDSQGEQEWFKTNSSFSGLSIEKASDGGYFIYDSGMKLVKTDVNGNVEWLKDFDEGFTFGIGAAKQLSTGGYVVVGTTQGSNSDFVILKTDSSGNIQ